MRTPGGGAQAIGGLGFGIATKLRFIQDVRSSEAMSLTGFRGDRDRSPSNPVRLTKRFARAVAEAQSGAGECSEVEPGRYRVRFVLGEEPTVYAALAGLLARVRRWRATELWEGSEQVSTEHAQEMAWCASFQLKSFRACRFRFHHGVLPRCSVCPLFDAERAIRDVLGENPPPSNVFGITLGPNVLAMLRGELPADPGPSFEIPDFPPQEWGQPLGDEPRS